GGERRGYLDGRCVGAILQPWPGLHEPEDGCVRELLFTRITNLDRDDLVAAGELDQRALPVTRAAEVADDDDDRSLSRERAGAPQRRAERRRTDPCVGVVDP